MKYALALMLTVAACSPAYAQQANNCGPRDAVLKVLTERYGETRHSIGLADNNAIVEMFASEETGTWTITVTTPAGMTCLVVSGSDFVAISEALPPKGEDM